LAAQLQNESKMIRAKQVRSKQRIEIGKHLVMDPEVYHGELAFKGTRVPVDVVLTYVVEGMSITEVPENWPDVSVEAVTEAVAFAKEALTKISPQLIDEPN
jgi:uncharacterized protein (DUF433 family)